MKWHKKCAEQARKGMLMTEIPLVELVQITNLTMDGNMEDRKSHLKGLPFNQFH